MMELLRAVKPFLIYLVNNEPLRISMQAGAILQWSDQRYPPIK